MSTSLPARRLPSIHRHRPPLTPPNLQLQIRQCRAQVVGWPPVQNYWKNILAASASKTKAPMEEATSGVGDPMYMKVSMDGAPFLMKVDIKMYSSYEDLSIAFKKMFSCFITGDWLTNGSKADDLHDQEYVLTYEDKDGAGCLLGILPGNLLKLPLKTNVVQVLS